MSFRPNVPRAAGVGVTHPIPESELNPVVVKKRNKGENTKKS